MQVNFRKILVNFFLFPITLLALVLYLYFVFNPQALPQPVLAYFEKSVDAKNFVAVANVKAAGNSNQAISYSYSDKEAGSSAYYRIKQFDFDGKYAIYNAKYTICESLENVELYPNPATNSITVDHFEGESLIIYFLNIVGQTIYKTEINNEGLNNIDISSLENGYYVVKIVDKNNNYKVFNLIKQK
jgi:hypothetical protein